MAVKFEMSGFVSALAGKGPDFGHKIQRAILNSKSASQLIENLAAERPRFEKKPALFNQALEALGKKFCMAQKQKKDAFNALAFGGSKPFILTDVEASQQLPFPCT